MKQSEWQVEWLEVNSVTPYKNNARKNDDTVPYLKRSIERFGFRVPLVIDADGIVVCGHTRLKAALELGMTKVPCVRVTDLTEDEIKAFRLADNKIAEMSSWDYSVLDEELEGLKEDGFDDMEGFGFADDIFSGDDEPGPEASDGDAAPDVDKTDDGEEKKRIVILFEESEREQLEQLLATKLDGAFCTVKLESIIEAKAAKES